MQVFVLQDNSISVTATVPSAASTSTTATSTGEGNGPLILAQMLQTLTVQFFNIRAIQVNEEQIYVQWTTNVPGTNYVVYGTASPSSLGTPPRFGYAFQTVKSDSKSTQHGVLVSGLQAGQLYHFLPVVSVNGTLYTGKEVQMTPLFRTQTITEVVTEEGTLRPVIEPSSSGTARCLTTSSNSSAAPTA